MKIFTLFFLLVLTNYPSVKTNIESKRKELQLSYNNSISKNEIIEKAQKELTKQLYENIIPHWYETKWSFEGHTEIPKQGTIACGYFVSTTLRDVGFNINRYKLAQKSPEDEAKIIACGTSIRKMNAISKTELKNYFLAEKDGFFFIGLDFHVGYIYKSGKEIYFIHSNYIDSKGVVKETIENSKAIVSQKYFIVPISNNENLMKKWILKEKISII